MSTAQTPDRQRTVDESGLGEAPAQTKVAARIVPALRLAATQAASSKSASRHIAR